MKNIAVVFGGKSPEHEISVRSAKNIIAAMDQSQFNLHYMGIDRAGQWRLVDLAKVDKYVPEQGIELAFVPGTKDPIIRMDSGKPIQDIDLMYLVLHGPNGEDGTVQGLMRILDLPFIGPDVLGSAAAMDKAVTKSLLKEVGVQVAPGLVVYKSDKNKLNYEAIVAEFGSPLFIKPANMGSSVGVHKVTNATRFAKALDDAFLYDQKVLIESMIVGREVECAVMGNVQPRTSTIGEIVTPEEYSFDAKYDSQSAAQVIIPAQIDAETVQRLQEVARKAYMAIGCEVLTRVDMFLTENGEIYVNELNTLPGFTNISMFPQLWEHEGMTYTELINQLIAYALERDQRRKQLKMNW
jgi:D-alanine-D-alanine ligase